MTSEAHETSKRNAIASWPTGPIPCELCVVQFSGAKDTTPQLCDTTWSEISAFLIADPELVPFDVRTLPDEARKRIVNPIKASGNAISFARYADGATRSDEGVVGLSAVAYDYDTDVTLDVLRALFAELLGVAFAAYTSFSSAFAGEGRVKLRVVIPFTREVSPDEYARVWAAVADQLRDATGVNVDASCANPSRIFFTPRCFEAHAAQHQRWVGLGDALDVDAVLASTPTPTAESTGADSDSLDFFTRAALSRWEAANPWPDGEPGPSDRFDCCCGSSDGAALLPDGKLFCHGAKHHDMDPMVGAPSGNGYVMHRIEWQLGIPWSQVPPKLLQLGHLPAPPVRKAANTNGEGAAAPGAKCFVFRGPEEIFAPKPPKKWTCRDLQLGPGRVNLLVGEAGSGKTWFAQDLAIAVASGMRVCGQFIVDKGIARHIDFEQGEEDTELRYAKLLRGRGIAQELLGDRLQFTAFAPVRLIDASHNEEALQAWTAAAEGATVLIVDSLLAACPGIDENESKSRAYLDTLTSVSHATGCCIIVLHHAGKQTEKSNRRHMARGTSGFRDAAGCMLTFTQVGSKIHIEQAKQPAMAPGGEFVGCQAELRDTRGPGGHGVQMIASRAPSRDELDAGQFKLDQERLVGIIAANPQIGASLLTEKFGSGARNGRVTTRVKALCEALERDGRVMQLPSGKKTIFSLTGAELARQH